MRTPVRIALSTVLLAACVLAQSKKGYSGPRPPKPDLPYLLHATELIPTEVGEAREDKRKDEVANVLSGASSTAKTPLPEPIFLLSAEKLSAEKLELYKMSVKNGGREVSVPNNPKKRGKDTARPLRLGVTRLEAGLYRVEVGEILEPGEYCLTPQGDNRVFCFQVY
ncbi:MAG: hypothetical protein U0Q16_00420 [Bryobacteraceae bacterium]